MNGDSDTAHSGLESYQLEPLAMRAAAGGNQR